MKTYLDITVYISPESEGTYAVRVESSQGGQGHSRLKLPFTLRDLAGVVFGVEEMLPLAGKSPAEAESGDQIERARRSPADFGVELFEALFQGECRDVLTAADHSAQACVDTGVRVRLSMDLRARGMAEVASLPWELMCRRGGRPLAVSTQTPLVRSLDTPRPTEPRPFRAPLRILALMSNPKGSDMLDLDSELAAIKDSWAQLPGVQVDYVRPVRAEILKKLAVGDYHVIHYMGHGNFEADAGGMLLLELEDGSPDPITSDEFAMWLADEPLRLVFLNACMTGTTDMQTSVHPFAGVAAALIKDRVPAVVAMQFPISDQAAVAFAQTFYERIAQGFPVDAAVAEGRKVLYSSEHMEWATPVLYLRSKDGMLFGAASDGTAAASTPTPGPIQVVAEPDSNTEDPWGPNAEDTLRVFLATPDQDREKLHRQLSRALADMGGLSIIDSVPLVEESHGELVDNLVRQADLCIHLLAANPGKQMDTDDSQPLRTYPLEQLEIGYQAARSQMVVITQQDRESIGNVDYKARVDELAKRPREKARFELVITDKTQIMDAVKEKLDELRTARQTKLASNTTDNEVRHAFVDSHVSDGQCAIKLLEFLENGNLSTDIRTSSSPVADYAQLDEKVKKYALYIIVAGGVHSQWASSRKIAVLKSAMRTKATLLLAKYCSTLDEESSDPELTQSRFEISALKDSDPSWFRALFDAAPGEET